MWKPAGILAVGLVPVSAAAGDRVASTVTPLSWRMAFVLGAILTGADPVAVTALGRRLVLPPKVRARAVPTHMCGVPHGRAGICARMAG